jgi:hypothetical protein
MPDDRTAEFDLHGAVGIRLIDADPADARTIERQLGPRSRLERRPDLLIRFVDRMPMAGELRYLGSEEAGYTDDRYLVLRGREKSGVVVAIPFEDIAADGPCEIVAERGLRAVPLLVAIVNLTAFANGRLPLHAGAFVHDGHGVLTIGWAKGGKSETLLAFTSQGSEFVGDEWIYLDPATGRAQALPEPMRIWDWQIRALPDVAGRIPRADRRRLAAIRAAARALRVVGELPVVGRSAVGRAATRVRVLVEQQLSVQVPTARLLGRDPLPDGAPIDRIVLVTSHASDAMTIESIEAADVARRATQSFLFEMTDFFGHYRRFRFAFPSLRNPRIDDLERRYEAAALEALGAIPAIAVGHPYPLRIERLFEAIAPALEGGVGARPHQSAGRVAPD